MQIVNYFFPKKVAIEPFCDIMDHDVTECQAHIWIHTLTLSSCILAASRNCCLATAFLAQLSTLSAYTSSSNAHCCCVETECTTRVLKPHSILSTSSCDVFSRNFSRNSAPSKGGICTCSVVVEGLALRVRTRETLKDDVLPWLGVLGRCRGGACCGGACCGDEYTMQWPF